MRGRLALTIALLAAPAAQAADAPSPPPASDGVYRLPYADGVMVKVFDDAESHRPRGRVDLFGVKGSGPYRVVAAAAGRVMAIQDSYGEQQTGRAAALCHNNY